MGLYHNYPDAILNPKSTRYRYKLPSESLLTYIDFQGISYDKMVQLRESRLNPALTTYYENPLVFHQGHKQWLFDIEGNRYLDMFGGICTVSVGHSHP